MDWLNYFVNLAEQVKLRSKDEHKQIGTVIVGPDHEIRSTGYNSFPRGIDDSVPARQGRDDGEKYFWFEHSERNACYNAARVGVSLRGCTAYLTCGCPCADCARAFIQVGIKTVWIRAGITSSNPKWQESIKRSLQMFREADVWVRWWAYDVIKQEAVQVGAGTQFAE